MKKMITNTAGAVSLLALAVGGTSAVAAPLFGFSQHAGFSTPTFFGGQLQFKAGSTISNVDLLAPAGTTTRFAWEGDNPNAESSITIQDWDNGDSPDADPKDPTNQLKFNSGGTADADGEWNEGDLWVITTLTQQNETLTDLGGAEADPLWKVDALANLRIYSDVSRTDLVFADATSTTNISFNETLNQATCADAPLGTICDDVFTITTVSLAPVFFFDDGRTYRLNFALLPGTSTTGVAETPAGLSFIRDEGDGNISVFSPENNPGTSSIHVAMSWTQVPEPSALGLISAGVLGLGLAARRRRKLA